MTLVNADTGEVVHGEIVGALPALPDDAAVLEAVADPGAYMVVALGRAKAWLEQARVTDLPDVVEAKARAEAIRCYTAQKELGHDAELSATEIVRRAERRIAQLVREGQEAGEIRPPKFKPRSSNPDDHRPSGSSYFKNDQERTDSYELADGVPDDEFEKAIEEAREEGNLSRANVKRKVSQKPEAKLARANGNAPRRPLGDRLQEIRDLAAAGNNSRQIAVKMGASDENVRAVARKNGIDIPADAVTGRTRKLDSNRIVRESVASLEGVALGLTHADPHGLDPAESEAWATSLKTSLKTIQAFVKEMTRGEA